MRLKLFLIKKIDSVKNLFLQGLFTVLPVFFTVSIVGFAYDFISKWLKPLKSLQPEVLRNIPGSEFIIVTLAIFLLGFVLKLFFIVPLINKIESFISHVPFVRTVYSSSKTVVNFFNISDLTNKARKVVLIEFPRKGLFNVAFLLESAEDNFQHLIPEEKRKEGKKYFKVFMPNSPNPTSGYFIVVAEDEIISTDMTLEEALKVVVSCGLITPASITK
jgi:uncharacterized membrane protein